MLKEIKCEKFSEKIPGKTIRFGPGLNCVLGGEDAVNSVGKSTLLLIIDFCFGGDSYTKQEDILAHVGPHTIYFTFLFGNKSYSFSRATSKPDYYQECTSDYETIGEEKKISELSAFLKNMYFPSLVDGSFRSLVSRFMRIHTKNNYNVAKPLESFPGEKEADGIKGLEELFDVYAAVKPFREEYQKATDEKKAFLSAKNFGYVHLSIENEKQREKAVEEVDAFQSKMMSSLQDNFDQELFSADDITEENLSLISSYRSLKRQKQKLQTTLNRLESMTGSGELMNDDDYASLREWFPAVNLKSLEEVNEFQKRLIKNVNEEVISEKERLEASLRDLEAQLESTKKELEEKKIPATITKSFAESYSQQKEKIDALKKQIDLYDKKEKVYSMCRKTKEDFDKANSKVAPSVEAQINNRLSSFNGTLYREKRRPPEIHIYDATHYSYSTPSDFGTGTSFKSLILFDIAVLNISYLPVIIHDSLLYKNIWDEPTQGLFELYSQQTKQIFVAIDRIGVFDADTVKIIKDAAVIRLGSNDNSLFGFSWANK